MKKIHYIIFLTVLFVYVTFTQHMIIEYDNINEQLSQKIDLLIDNCNPGSNSLPNKDLNERYYEI